MDDEDEMDLTGTFVLDGELTRKLNTLRTISQPERATVDPKTLQATARIDIPQSVKTPVRRAQRVLAWFRRD